MYAFTGDVLYKNKAQEVVDKLLPAFQTPTGIPRAIINTAGGVSRLINLNPIFSDNTRINLSVVQ